MECGKGELPIGRPFRHAPQNGTLLGGSKKGAAAPFFFHRIDRLRRSGGAIFRSVSAENQFRISKNAADENSSGAQPQRGVFSTAFRSALISVLAA